MRGLTRRLVAVAAAATSIVAAFPAVAQAHAKPYVNWAANSPHVFSQ